MDITPDEVLAVRVARGVGMMEAKRIVIQEKLTVGVEAYRNTGDRELLADILDELVKNVRL